MSDPFSASRVEQFDPHGVRELYGRWPALSRDGYSAKVGLEKTGFKKAYFLGMGGSASAGDILASWLYDRPGIQMAVFKGQVPIGDMSDSLAVACSASGGTKETIGMLQTALSRRATAICISSGGALRDLAEKEGVPHVMMPEIVAPRYMLPFIVFSALAVLGHALDLDCDEEAKGAIGEMEELRRDISTDSPEPRNESKAIARTLLNKIPSIYGTRSTRGVGIRFKNVLNENAKIHSLFDGLPDAFHNEIEAWEDGGTNFQPVFLRHPNDGTSERARADHMMEMLRRQRLVPTIVNGRGPTSLAKLMSMTYMLDMASYYVALGLGRDPFPTALMDELKKYT